MALYDFNQFTASLAKGNARANRFETIFNLPTALQVSYERQKNLNIRLESVSFPGKNIRTVTNENTYGPTYEIAQGLTYGEEVSMTFLLQNNHEQRWIFNSWQDMIVSPTTYNVSYYNDYIGQVMVFQIDEQGKTSAGIILKDVYPKTIGAIEMSNASSNELVKTTIGFTFREWVPLEVDYISGAYREYPEYSPKTITRTRTGLGRVIKDSFPPQNRPTGTAHVDNFPGREKGMFEDAGRAVNQALEARNQVVQFGNKVAAFRNFFKGITKSTNPLGNLGIGGFGGF
jgi:hypothetical protein